jgi:octaprenyl-diphosphate synthase
MAEAGAREHLALIEGELAEVEAQILAGLKSNTSLISAISQYVLGSGGKRIRPALLLLSARLCDGIEAAGRGVGPSGAAGADRRTRLAAVAEYIHAATLIHDDIIDDADTRRGLPSAQARWGPDISVLIGDFLYSRSIQILIDDGDFAVMKTFADATVWMTEGEVFQLQMRRNLDLTYEDYLRIISAKTAALFSAACRAGALVAGAPAERAEAMTEFGLHLGIGFQLVDDALDFVATRERMGKPVGKDLAEGRITYPIIHVLQTGDPADRERIRALAVKARLGPGDLEEIKALVERNGGVAAARGEAGGYLDKARGRLEGFPASPARAALSRLMDYILERDR